MCWKWFLDLFKTDPVEPIIGNRVALIFTIGDYPSYQNDLEGPPYDSVNVRKFFEDKYPEFTIGLFSDSEVTRYTFDNVIKTQIESLKPGDILLVYYSGHGTQGLDANEPDGYREGLYLYNGTYWDDEFTSILQDIPEGAKVIIVLDSCFAHGSTEPKGNPGSGVYKKSKFVQTQKISKRLRRTKAILKADMMNYIVFAACGEDQTSSDTYISGEPCGAFTHFWLEAWSRELDYLAWNDKTASLIKYDGGYDQRPNIEGDFNLQKQIVLI